MVMLPSMVTLILHVPLCKMRGFAAGCPESDVKGLIINSLQIVK